MPCFTAFCSLMIHRYCGVSFFVLFCFLTNWRAVLWASLSWPFLHLLTSSLCVTYWQYFGLLHHFYICYGNLSSATFGVTVGLFGGSMKWATYDGTFNQPELRSDCPPAGRSLISFPLLRLPCSLTHNNMELGQLITLRWPQSVQVKKKSHTSLTLNCKNAKFFFKLNRKPEARRSGVWSTFFNRKSCWKPRQRTARLRHQVSQVAVISVGEVVYHLVHKTPSHPLLRGTKRKQRKPRLQSYLLIARLWLSGLVFWTSVSTSLKWGETSLMVQWLRYHACTAGGAGSIPGPGTKLPYACLSVWQKKKKTIK